VNGSLPITGSFPDISNWWSLPPPPFEGILVCTPKVCRLDGQTSYITEQDNSKNVSAMLMNLLKRMLFVADSVLVTLNVYDDDDDVVKCFKRF